MGTPSETAVKYLFANSRNLCFFNMPDEPGCETTLTDKNFKRCRGQIAHIRADSPNGPRFDPDQSEVDRQAEPNLMLLCPNCHKRIDELEPERFDVDTLTEMKARHLSHMSDFRPDPTTVQFVVNDMIRYLVERRQSSGGDVTNVAGDLELTGATEVEKIPGRWRAHEHAATAAGVSETAGTAKASTEAPESNDVAVAAVASVGVGALATTTTNIDADTRIEAQPATLHLEGVPGVIHRAEAGVAKGSGQAHDPSASVAPVAGSARASARHDGTATPEPVALKAEIPPATATGGTGEPAKPLSEIPPITIKITDEDTVDPANLNRVVGNPTIRNLQLPPRPTTEVSDEELIDADVDVWNSEPDQP
jgi:hypothetical protein